MIRTPHGLRWSCGGCGSCCTSEYELGPVEPEVIADLTSAGIGQLWEPAAAGWSHDKAAGAFLDTVDGHCIFLREDLRCAVHDLVGAERKPGFCREFPYHLVEDPAGLVAVVRPTCRGFHHSFADGDLADDQVEAIAALPRAAPRRSFHPKSVSVLDGASVAVDAWMAMERSLLVEVAALPFEAAIEHVRASLHNQTGTVEPAVRPEQRVAALQATVAALAMIMRHTLQRSDGQDPDRVAFAQESVKRLDAVSATSADPAPPLAQDAEDWVNLLLRSYILGKRFEVWGGVAEGLGEFILAIEVSRRLAEPDKDGQITAAALSEPMAQWRRFVAIELITMILQKARPALIDLFLHTRPA